MTRSTSGPAGRSTVWRLWRQCTEPSPDLDEGERRTARLLATLLIVVIPVGLASAVLQLATVPTFRPAFPMVMGALLVLTLCYLLARTVHYRLAGAMTSLVPIAAGGAVGLVRPADPAWFAFMTLGTLFASAFLELRIVWAIAALTVSATATVLFASSRPLQSPDSAAILTFTVLVSSLTVVVSRHRLLLEQDRERRNRDNEARYRILFENAPLGIGVVSADGRLVEVNDAMLRPGGYVRADLATVGNVTQLYRDPAQRLRLLEEVEREGRIVGEEVEILAKDGTPYQVALSVVPITLGGEPHSLAIVEDITVRKQAEAERRRADEERSGLADTIERSLNEIYLFDAQTLRFEYANQGARRNIGYSLEELGALTPVDLKPEFSEVAFRAKLGPLLRGETPLLSFETVHRRADGTTYPVDVRLQRTVRSGRELVLAIILDISELKRVQAQFLQAQKLESIGRLAGGVAHDFNNLLTVIKGNLELALAVAPLADESHRNLMEASAAADSAASLTRQLLAFSRRQIIAPQVLNLNDVIGKAEALLRRLLGEHIDLEVRPAPNLGQVRFDPGQCEQVLVNLAVNARDAMPDGGKLTLATKNVGQASESLGNDGVARSGEYVVLTVSDTGSGMSSEVMAHIFEPFYTTKPLGIGTGLGLAMVEGVVSQHGGRVEVSSQLGSGTTFSVWLPRVHEIAAPASLRPAEAALHGTETVVLVEDDDLVRDLASRLLRRLGYSVHAFRDGATAVDAVRGMSEPIHLLIADVVMPTMNGRVVADQLTALRPGLRVLFTSGYTSDVIAHHGVLDEGVEFLAKPYSIGSVARRVREVLDAPAH